jgi:diguanylate cyclase (GGDEF)-like protein
MTNKAALKIRGFSLSSSSEVLEVIRKVEELRNEHILIHVTSFIHNTVLVQNLKTQLTKNLPHAKVVFLQHEDKANTTVEVYILDKNVEADNMSDAVLHELYLENSYQNSSIQDYRNKLFNRYFTDHLTNLPNMYKLRKDLDELEDFGLIIIGIDNFKTINNFYGFIVGDYIIEEAGRYLQANIPELRVYKLNGAEFGLVLEKSLGFYDLKQYLSNLYERVKDIKITYQKMDIYLDLTLASCVNNKLNNIFSKVSMALKYAKGIGVPFWIYEDRMNFEVEYERNLHLSGIVRDAVQKSRIVPYFQAILDNKTGQIVRAHLIWPPRAFAFGQLTHQHLATSRIDYLAG